jgi:hypothetical protein
MHTTLDDSLLDGIVDRVERAARRLDRGRAGRPTPRMPVQSLRLSPESLHPDSARRAGRSALRLLEQHAPDAVALARGLRLPGWEALPRTPERVDSLLSRLERDAGAVRAREPEAWLAHQVYARTVRKLQREPVEELCIDFHTAYGVRPDDEEDATAAAAAVALARGLADDTLPPFVAVRIKPLEAPTAARALRTLDLLVSTLVDRAGSVPARLAVVLPEAGNTEQVRGLVQALAALEQQNALRKGSLRVVLGVDHPGTLVDASGRVHIRALCDASASRCHRVDHDPVATATSAGRRAHSAREGIERALLATALEGIDVLLASGGTDAEPRVPNRGPGLTPSEQDENVRAVHGAWRQTYEVTLDSLSDGVTSGVDFYAGQLPARYAAWVVHVLQTLEGQLQALHRWVSEGLQLPESPERLARGQARLEAVLRGLDCGALLPEELAAAGLDEADLGDRSAQTLLARRRPIAPDGLR